MCIPPCMLGVGQHCWGKSSVRTISHLFVNITIHKYRMMMLRTNLWSCRISKTGLNWKHSPTWSACTSKISRVKSSSMRVQTWYITVLLKLNTNILKWIPTHHEATYLTQSYMVFYFHFIWRSLKGNQIAILGGDVFRGMTKLHHL